MTYAFSTSPVAASAAECRSRKKMTVSVGREPLRTAGRTWDKMETAFSARPNFTYSWAVSIVRDTYTWRFNGVG